MIRALLIIILAVFIVSCASTQPVEVEVLSEKEAEKELILPDIPMEKEPVPEDKVIKKTFPPVTIETEAAEKYVILNFDDADIRTVIETMGDLLNINYILVPGVSGKVTIQSYKKFPVKNLFSIFQTILELNGLTAVENKDFYVIMPIESAKQQPLDVETGKDVGMKLDSGFITQIIPLEFVKASDAANLMRELMPRGTDLIVYEPTNLLIVTARPEGLIKFMKLLAAIDIAPSERENIRTFVYYVENGEAKKLADILKDIYLDQKDKKTTAQAQPRRITTARGTTRRTSAEQPAPATATVVGGTAGELEGDITITSYEEINAIIIKSSPAAYLAMMETIKKLDIAPKQVLIEVLVAEVTLTDDLSLGIEWLLKTQGSPTLLTGLTPSLLSVDDASVDTTTAPSKNFFGFIIDPMKFVGLIQTFASYGQVNVLSSPHILALDNKEAKIEVGEEIPIATGLNTTSTVDEGATALVSAGQIQYRTAGVIITVTPHINDKDKVTMKISQEFSGPGDETIVAGQEFPSFFTRRTETTGIVQNGHTLVIGGLISEQKTDSQGGIPYLSKIPIIGRLFGTSSVNTRRSELVVMVTPYVIRNQEDADFRTQEFQQRIRLVSDRIEELEKEKDKYERQKREKESPGEKEGGI